MIIWVTDAKHAGDFSLILSFNDGRTGVVDLRDDLTGEVFEPLRNEAYFRQFQVGDWSVEWPNGADFAPEFLYEKIND